MRCGATLRNSEVPCGHRGPKTYCPGPCCVHCPLPPGPSFSVVSTVLLVNTSLPVVRDSADNEGQLLPLQRTLVNSESDITVGVSY